MNLGRYPDISLKDARELCQKHRKLLEHHIDPQEHALETKLEQNRKKAEADRKKLEAERRGSVALLFERYVADMKAQGKTSYKEVERALNRDALPSLGSTVKANQIKPSDIKFILAKVIQRGSLVQANRLRSYLSAAFNYGILHDNDPVNLSSNVLFFLESNPARDIPKQKKAEKAGERHLSEDEIQSLWQKLEHANIHISIKLLIKLLFSTGGQRIKELLTSYWSDIDFDNAVWELSTTKNGRPHVIPLNSLSLELLTELKSYTESSGRLFPKINERKDYTGEVNHIPLDSVSQTIYRFCNNQKFEKFTPRDIRRTCKTLMGKIGISKEIRDRIHNHSLHDVSSRHYDRYSYLEEKTHALNLWCDFIEMHTLKNNI